MSPRVQCLSGPADRPLCPVVVADCFTPTGLQDDLCGTDPIGSNHDLLRPDFSLYQSSWLETLQRNPFFYLYALWALGSLIALGRGRARADLAAFLRRDGGGHDAEPETTMAVLFRPSGSHAVRLTCRSILSRVRGAAELLRPWVFPLCYGLFGVLIPSPSARRGGARPGAQRHTIELTEALLGPEDRYFAGFPFLYRREANSRSLSAVDSTSASPTYTLTSAQIAGILERLRAEPIRLLVYNWNIELEVPKLIRRPPVSQLCTALGERLDLRPSSQAVRLRGEPSIHGRLLN